jgi:isoquinoline 1-oxidoreductase beta subunit
MGLNQAVVSEITFKNGRSVQDNFHQYEIVRMNMAPKRIIVHFIPSDSLDMALGGVGEPGVPVIAPALMNAISGVTGKRVRRLPLRDQLFTPV